MKRKLVVSFLAGACASGLVAAFALQHSERVIQDAWVARQDHNSATIRFNHDATDQVVSVHVPIPEFPTTRGHQSGVKVTVTIWHEADGVTEELMKSSAFDVEAMKFREVVGWRAGPLNLYEAEGAQP